MYQYVPCVASLKKRVLRKQAAPDKHVDALLLLSSFTDTFCFTPHVESEFEVKAGKVFYLHL